MGFKPFTKKYTFTKDVLVENFPVYLRDPLVSWLRDVLLFSGVIETVNIQYRDTIVLKDEFRHLLNLTFREDFPYKFTDFLSHIFSSNERITNFLSFRYEKLCC
jgi:hypothetical protein